MKNNKFIVTLIAVAAWFTPAVANARNPISQFCVAHIANATADGHTKDAHLDECAICEAQRDNNWPELGNINNETCNGLAEKLLPGKAASCDANWPRGLCVAFQRCLSAGTETNHGGIAFTIANTPTPPDKRPVVDSAALGARQDARAKAQVALDKANDEARKAALEVQSATSWLLGRSQVKAKKQVRPPTPFEWVAIPASTGIIGGIGGSLGGWAFDGAVLTTGLASAGIGLGVGALAVLIWEGVAHESATVTVPMPAAAASP